MKKRLLFFRGLRISGLLIFLLLYGFTEQLNAQSKISGRVTDDAGPLPGVSIVVKGSNTATSSDSKGDYSIVASSDAVLVFSSIGYKSAEVAVNGRTAINVVLTSEAQTLEAVVVVGYGTQKREDITGSISSVTAAQIEKVPVTTLDQALQGRSAGVQVTSNDGAPGAGVNVLIRGIGSFGNNEPLYVVDGYAVSGGLGNLNTNDIASIDILKDASATAIYGNRASNGVVIVTTKRGRGDGIQISLDAYTSAQSEPKMHKMLSAEQFATLANERLIADGIGAEPQWSNPSALRTVDWQKEIYRQGLRQDYNFSLRGGSEKLQSALSLGYLNQKGIVLASNYKRYNASLNTDYSATKWLKASASIKYSRNDSKVGLGTGGQDAGQGIMTLNRLIPTLTGNPLTDQAKDADGNYGYYPKSNQYLSNQSNILADLDTQDQQNLTNYFLGNGYLEATILEGLKVKTAYGINTNDYSGYYFTPSNNRKPAPVSSFYSQNANNTFEYLWENTLSYTRSFGIHSIDAVAGVSQQENTYRYMGGQGNGSVSDELRDLNRVTTITSITGGRQIYSLASQFARVNYKLADKYYVTATVRRDGSSKFAAGHQYGIFPSASVAWRVKNESFLKDSRVISDLKIRAGYGEVGNQAGIAPFRYLGLYGTGGSALEYSNNGYPFNKVYQEGLVLTALPNPDLKWETSKQTDIGLDLAILNGRLSFTADYYIKESKDFLLEIDVPAQTGFSKATRNVGSVRNRGLELGLTYREAETAFKYGVALNVTTVNNKILSLVDGLDAVYNLNTLNFPTTTTNTWVVFTESRVGGSIGEFYGYKADGIFQTQAEVDALNTKAASLGGDYYQTSKTVPGDRKFKDLNGDGKITGEDRIALGSPLPKFYSGLNLDASFKEFDFNMFWYASVGNKIFNYVNRNLESFGSTSGDIGIQNISENYYLNRWTPSNPSSRYARVTRLDENSTGAPSDVYVEDGSYLRMKSVQLGYTLPAATSFMQQAGISKIRLYVSAQNLFTITKYSGLDPEIGTPAGQNGGRGVTANGIDVGTYPNSKFFTFGLNVTF